MSQLCCNKTQVSKITNDVASTREHSPTHPHRHSLNTNDQLENLISPENENLRRCLANVKEIPNSELSNLKMPKLTTA